MPKIYTRTGDGGETSLLSGGRVTKDHPLVEACGTIDELNSLIGLLLSEPLPDVVSERLRATQETLFTLGSVLADPNGRLESDERAWAADRLERWIDAMEDELEPLRAFVLPGGSRSAALAHLTRTVCRRAERTVSAVAESGIPAGVVAYLNRLSDWLFVLARWLNAQLGIEEIRWNAGSESPD